MADYSLDLFTTRNPFLGLSPQPYSTRGDRLARKIGLEDLQRRNQMGNLDLANAQDEYKKRQRIQEIWQQTGGNVEQAIPLIMQVDPVLGDKLRQNELARQEAERGAAMQNYKMQEGMPAPEVQAGPQGSYQPPSQVPEGGSVAPIQSPIPAGFTKELPTESVNIPGVGGVPGFTAKPETYQEKYRKMLAEAQSKADIQRNANTYTITDPTTGRTITAPKDIIDNVITQLGENYRLQNKPTGGALTSAIQEYNLYAQQEKEAGRKPVSFDTWQTRDANRKATTVNGTPKALTQTAEARLIDQQSQRWTKATAPNRELNRQLGLMETGLSQAKAGNAAAGSQAVLVTFQKILDPTSVVRESEYARSGEGQSLLNRMQGYVERLQKGGAGVPVAELENFAKVARDFAKGSQAYVNGEKKRIGMILDRYQLPHELVINEEGLTSGDSAGAGGGDQVSNSGRKRGVYNPATGKVEYK